MYVYFSDCKQVYIYSNLLFNFLNSVVVIVQLVKVCCILIIVRSV